VLAGAEVPGACWRGLQQHPQLLHLQQQDLHALLQPGGMQPDCSLTALGRGLPAPVAA
jgi:hypothetical protein